MRWFLNDYSEGAEPRVLEKLIAGNPQSDEGYGEDAACEAARALIRSETACPDALIRFIPGGTQTNLLMIGHALRPYEAVISADTGHINVHETGAIEACGHKVLTAACRDGKLTCELIDSVLSQHEGPHMVKPGMVYLSNSTELGTHYTLGELNAISAYCREKGLILYMDGARLASGLMAEGCDLTLADIARLTDCFYIGGTKSGALFGEALVVVNRSLQKEIDYSIKRRGAMMAKGRLMGLQFLALFEDGLYYEIGRRENQMAHRLRLGIERAGYEFYTDSRTNQLFPILPSAVAERLAEDFRFMVQMRMGARTVVRFVVSWATTQADIDALIDAM